MAGSFISMPQRRKLFKRKKSSSLPSLPRAPAITPENGENGDHPSQPGDALWGNLGPQYV